MTKSDVSYASVPVAEPYVEGFSVGSSHAVTVIVDENDRRQSGRSHYYNPEVDALLHGSRKPIQMAVCPHCSASQIRTRTKTYPSFVTWAGVVVTGVVFFPLFWVPLVVDPMKQTDHYCQNCSKKIGTVKALHGCFIKEQV